MKEIIITFYTGKHIGNEESANNYFKILSNYSLIPDKIGLFEPLKQNYSIEEAIKMWTCMSGNEPDFRLGMIIGKKKEPNFRFDVEWHIGERARANDITLWFTKNSYNKLRSQIPNLFKELIVSFNSFYAYITDNELENRQHVTGTIETRLPGVFWCNFFGNIFVDHIGKARIMNSPWHKVEMLDDLGIITYLAETPDKLIESDSIEKKFKAKLGNDFFGDVEEFVRSNYKQQIKNMPKLELSEIRRPIESFINNDS